jgi:hypothetical protein
LRVEWRIWGEGGRIRSRLGIEGHNGAELLWSSGGYVDGRPGEGSLPENVVVFLTPDGHGQMAYERMACGASCHFSAEVLGFSDGEVRPLLSAIPHEPRIVPFSRLLLVSKSELGYRRRPDGQEIGRHTAQLFEWDGSAYELVDAVTTEFFTY